MFEVHGRGSTGIHGLKPMNCPGHCLLFKSQPRSYKELPVRYADFSPLHRNEKAGALSGLTRVRRFHQDDGHIFCRPSQIAEEISRTLDFVAMVYRTFRLGPYKLVLSTRPKEQYIGTVEEWDRAERQLQSALDRSGQDWTHSPGDGAFYGPKIDIILKDSDGKQHQTATIQLDFQLPQRFELSYIAPAPEHEAKGMTTTDDEELSTHGPVTPVIIHRAIFGSLERFMALLIEHHKGRWPFWLSPNQAIILSAFGQHVPTLDDAVRMQAQTLSGALDLRLSSPSPSGDRRPILTRPRPLDEPVYAVSHDTSHDSLAKKISRAKKLQYNLIFIRGKRNLEKSTVDLDARAQPDQKATRKVLEEVTQKEIAGLQKVTLGVDQVGEVMRRLSRAYL